MKMKYFRFLYRKIGQCFLHFGELQDTMEEETYTFLYLRKVERHVKQTKSEHRPFLFPKHVNLAVLGSADEETLRALKELLRETEIDTLLVGGEKSAAWDELAGVRKIVKIENGTYQSGTAGWRFLARSFADGTVALVHGLSADAQEGVFDDCVMNVKALRKGMRCRQEASPDGYGCALGCALYQDYDVCRYRGNGNSPAFGTGTLIFGGRENEDECRKLFEEAQAQIGAIRFIGMTAGKAGTQIAVAEKYRAEGSDASAQNFDADAREQETLEEGFRRYLFGTEDLDEQTAAMLCRGGWDQRAVILKEGEGICCSGLLKYAGT